MPAIEATPYPQNLFLCEDSNGRVHCYRNDPMKTDNPKSQEINLYDELLAFFGHGDQINPVIFQIRGAKIDRATPFSLSVLESFRLGVAEDHLEDLDGHVVEIIMARNNDSGYPLNAVVIDKDGCMLCQRTYSSTGECSDGDPQHRLVMIAGPAVYNNTVAIEPQK